MKKDRPASRKDMLKMKIGKEIGGIHTHIGYHIKRYDGH